MLFSSVPFIFAFLPISLAGFFLLSRFFGTNVRLSWLAGCSLFFYGYWRVDYLPLLLGSIFVNYFIARTIQNGLRKSGRHDHYGFLLLLVGIILNLGLLGYYKYFDFFVVVANSVLKSEISTLHLILPLAISFFTFQQIAYLVDSYKGLAERSPFLNYLVFVSFFPQLIAGPIVHHKEMMPQFFRGAVGVLRWKDLLIGAVIFSLGLFKKIGIADQLAVYADMGYADSSQMTILDAWVASLSYTFQLYFDFSGYSDMAIGAARLFGIRLPINFNSPYKALSIQDFWRRWHITLSRFLRDYLYIPLGGGRGSEPRVAANVFITFLLGGFWHGAGWTFIVWGAIHGAALLVERLFSKVGLHLPRVIRWALTFLTVHLAWVFFRAESLPQALDILTTMLGGNPGATGGPSHVVIRDNATAVALLLFSFLVVLVMPNSQQFTANIRPLWKTYVAAILFGLGCFLMLVSRTEVFLYFNF